MNYTIEENRSPYVDLLTIAFKLVPGKFTRQQESRAVREVQLARFNLSPETLFRFGLTHLLCAGLTELEL